jgi:hypothetical protein
MKATEPEMTTKEASMITASMRPRAGWSLTCRMIWTSPA